MGPRRWLCKLFLVSPLPFVVHRVSICPWASATSFCFSVCRLAFSADSWFLSFLSLASMKLGPAVAGQQGMTLQLDSKWLSFFVPIPNSWESIWMAQLRSDIYPWVSHWHWWGMVIWYAVLFLPGTRVGQSLQGGMWVGKRECLAFLRQTGLRDVSWVVIKRTLDLELKK